MAPFTADALKRKKEDTPPGKDSQAPRAPLKAPRADLLPPSLAEMPDVAANIQAIQDALSEKPAEALHFDMPLSQIDSQPSQLMEIEDVNLSQELATPAAGEAIGGSGGSPPAVVGPGATPDTHDYAYGTNSAGLTLH